MLDRVRTRAVKTFILTAKYCYDAQNILFVTVANERQKKGIKAIYSSLRLAVLKPRLYRCI